MESVTIHARSASSARGLLRALATFHAELVESADGRCEITVELTGGDREVVAFLNALEEYINERDGHPARIELNGHQYVMHPTENGDRRDMVDAPVGGGSDER